MSLLFGAELEPIAHATAGLAYQEIRFDRDEADSYRIQLEAVRAPERSLPTRAQLMPALPVGSRWAPAVGWRSFIAYPFDSSTSSDFVLVALECVVPHASRGAYPILAGALIQQSDVELVLLRLAEHIHPRSVAAWFAHPSLPGYGVLPSDAASPREYVPREARLLCSAAATFAEGRRPLVRTLLLTEDEVPKARALSSPRDLLMGTVSVLREHFSTKARIILRGLSPP